MSYLNRISQNVVPDPNNSSHSNIAGLGSFIGLPTGTLGVAAIQVAFRSDQNCTVYVEQSNGLSMNGGTVSTSNPGGVGTIIGTGTTFTRDFIVGDQIIVSGETTHYIASITSNTGMTTTTTFLGVSGTSYQFFPWDISDEYSYRYITKPNFGKTIQAIGSYVRVRVKNISQSVTTLVFRLDTVLCPIVESIPRSLSPEGNLMVGVYEIEDEVGSKVRISPNGGLNICKVSRLIGVSFVGTTIDSNFWTSGTTANGSGVQIGGKYEMRTITAPATSSPNGASSLQSVRTARYINGISNYCRIQADYGGVGIPNNTKRWGAFTGTAGSPIDGCMFELINQVQTLALYNGGVPTRISNGSFNGEYGATLNEIPSGLQTFEIIWNNRYVYFYFNNVLVHKYEATTTPWSSILSLPCRAENYNTSSSTTDTSLKIRSFVILRYGEPESKTGWKYTHGTLSAANGILKRGGGTLHKIVNNDNLGTLSLYDGLTAANPIAIIDLSKIFGSVEYNLDFYNGLTMVQTDNGADTTIIYE